MATKTVSLLDTTIGQKLVVAITGFILFGFVFVHMLGHLQIFVGPEAYNDYAETLKAAAPVLWGARLVILTSTVLHVVYTMKLVSGAATARPVGYRQHQKAATTYAASMMRFSGPAVGLFLVFHILHFTAPGLGFGEFEFSETDAYANFVESFSIPILTIIYVAASCLVGMHLYHGGWSFLQTIGLSHPRYNKLRNGAARALAIIITVGFIAVPLAVQFGLVE